MIVDKTFEANWNVQMLERAPLIAPMRQFTYPRAVPGEEEALARGAMYALVRPESGGEFLATCARGFADGSLPTGIWSCPRVQEMCAVSGGYAVVVDTLAPESAFLIPMRPVTKVLALKEQELLLFVGFHTVLAYGSDGVKWETARLTWEGVTLGRIEGDMLHGMGWEMMSDKDLPFTIDLRTGEHTGGAFAATARKVSY